MAHVLIPLPSIDFDPSEVAVSWQVLTRLGHQISFATPDGKAAECDPIMISGRGLDPWSPVPIIGHLKVFGLLLSANADARAAYAAMVQEQAFRAPLKWEEARVEHFDAILLGGGHRARGMRRFLESERLQALVADFFAADKPVAAICHGVLLAARSKDQTGRSVLFGRRTTALAWHQERTASGLSHIGRFWDRNYYRTYTEEPGQAPGYMSVQQEVTRALQHPHDFIEVPKDDPNYRKKTSGMARDTVEDDRPAWVVRDGNYVSARWPGDAHTFARTFAQVLDERRGA
jgi:putative intracellular protease/amidase